MAFAQTSMTNPVPHQINHDFYDVGVTPDQAYSDWCLGLGVLDVGTDFTMPIKGMINIPSLANPYSEQYGWESNFSFGTGGELVFKAVAPSPIDPIYYHDLTGGNDTFLRLPSDRNNTVVIGIQTFAYVNFDGTDRTVADEWKIRISGNETLIRCRLRQDYSTTQLILQVAIRITASSITVVIESSTAPSFPGNHNIRIIETDAIGDVVSPGIEYSFDSDTVANKQLDLTLIRRTVGGTIDENLALDNFDVSLYDEATSIRIAQQVVNTSVDPAFTFDTAHADPVQIVVKAKVKIWTTNTVLVAGDVIFPTDPVTSPYYFIVSIGGTTGGTEPTWIDIAGDVVDNTVTFAWADRMVQPVTNAPVIPQIV